MNRLQNQSRRFEELAVTVLKAAGYEVNQEVRLRMGGRTLVVDARARRPDQDLLVEFKWTRRDPVPLVMLRQWAAQLSSYTTLALDAAFVLIVSGKVDEVHRDWIAEQFQIDVWDAERLAFLARDDGELFARLIDFRGATAELEAERLGRQDEQANAAPSEEPDETVRSTASDDLGATLVERLAAIPAGKSGAKDYENTCIDIVRYLFGEFLLDARPQSRTEDGLDVMDVIYRVKQQHSFWQTLTRDFSSRVIVFEFKNYSEPVGPRQLYSTERYLSSSAMRRICFLVSRQGPASNAELAAFGALREGGKLIVFLDDDDLKTMLRFRDAEVAARRAGQIVKDDASVVLDQKIYEFLATMGR